jgi:uncharacterized membrane protein YgcG
MKGLIMMLKAFGLSEEDVEKIRVFLPQVPTVAQNLIKGVNDSIAQFDSRLKKLEDAHIANAVLLTGILEQQHALGEKQKELGRFMNTCTRDINAVSESHKNHILGAINESIRSRELRSSDDTGNGTAHSGADSHSAGAVGGSSGGSGGGRKRGNR